MATFRRCRPRDHSIERLRSPQMQRTPLETACTSRPPASRDSANARQSKAEVSGYARNERQPSQTQGPWAAPTQPTSLCRRRGDSFVSAPQNSLLQSNEALSRDRFVACGNKPSESRKEILGITSATR